METSGIDNIQLTTDICLKLYPEGITNLKIKIAESAESFAYKGKNKKNVLIAIDTDGDLRKEDQQLLDNLLNACLLTPEDVALINMREQEISLSFMLKRLNIKKSIFFGIPSRIVDLPLPDSEESVIVYDNMFFVKTSPLSSLYDNVKKKRALWKALKDMFNI